MILTTYIFAFLLCATPIAGTKRVIVEVDPGVDDGWALLALLHGEKLGIVNILAIVCVHGNTDIQHTSKNVVRILEIVNRTDIPVYLGASKSIIPLEERFIGFHGEDGFADLEHETEPDTSIIKKEPAFQIIRELLLKTPRTISIISLGPLTNLALLLTLFDDVAQNIKEIYVMGGSSNAHGNDNSMSAEFNFYTDPEAAFVVLNRTMSPVVLFPWDICMATAIPLEWRLNVLGQAKRSPMLDLLNRAEKKIYSHTTNEEWFMCDLFTAIAMLEPDKTVVEQKWFYVTVELNGKYTRGQSVIDYKNTQNANVLILKNVSSKFIKKTTLEIANGL